MATDLHFVEFVVDQLRNIGTIRYRKMFGEYALYCDDTVVAFLCDNQFFLKPHPKLHAALENAIEAPPYPGAKNYLLLRDELEQAEKLSALIRLAKQVLPASQPKKSKKLPSK
ncbi:TfoX/Sxy family protein [Undibacterium fentianense]|uniref:TfoX/Sxy family protein n=1 Tax=Undibacterium fentianense TaxID=2828728 RepID=A0A941EAU1_9BURK|nr:TfoX/Sxy family protein [Undibacterium fentianense]MBR7801698.1 TfoX/Sxy family protein [Undibacterium fentianense]